MSDVIWQGKVHAHAPTVRIKPLAEKGATFEVLIGDSEGERWAAHACTLGERLKILTVALRELAAREGGVL